ncbi:AT-rich interactive domain-containing protein 5-like [Solanum stenotomum]|uniref:AT-rich interactive domain-containing protein 5-like n=1 Tax=Solanum stenotomum TaxID=172797 RepID=UPI0020D14A93|nr:AT-rich interactive domain-containing protein 5-like [Solanum stenotomum]
MDKGDVEMLDAGKNVPASDVLVPNESQVKYKNCVKTGKSNVEDKTHDQREKTPTIDVGMDNMVSGHVTSIDDEVHNIDEGEVNEVDQSEKMIYEGNQNEPASPMFLINPLTANTGHHSGEASNNISARMADGEDVEGSPEDQVAFIGKLCTFYQEKGMEFKPPMFSGH